LAILSDLPNLVSTLPAWASVFADKPSAGASPSKASAPPPNDSLPRKIGGGVTPPKVLFAGEPQYTPAARELKLSGNVLVYLQVDTNGNPIHIRLLRPLGLGLDEAAIRAVETYRFTPAMSNGKPVIVEMNVEVNFQIF
jgi:TonB family protein